MQEEEPDSCRVARKRRPEMERDEGAGRSPSGFSLPLVATQEAAPATGARGIEARQLS